MPVTALVLKRRVPYVLKEEQELVKKDKTYCPTTWWLEPPNPDELAEYRDAITGGSMHVAALKLVRKKLVLWENFVDKDDQQVPFPEGDNRKRTSQLAADWIFEFALKIDSLGEVDAEDLPPSDLPAG